MSLGNDSGVASIGRNFPGRDARQTPPGKPVIINQTPPIEMMAAAAVSQFDDVRPARRAGSGKGIGGRPGMFFNTEQTCNPDGQCWQVVAGTKEDREAAAKYDAYLQSQSKTVWETFGDAIGDAAGFVKNVAAGVVNATIPGADLGDANSVGQVLGQLVGTFTNPAGAVLGAISKGTMALNFGKVVSAATNVIGKANQFLTSPIGQIGSSVVGSLVSGSIQPAPNVAYPGAVRTSPFVPDATLYPGWMPGKLSGNSGTIRQQSLLPIKVQTPVGTVDTTKKEGVNMWVIAAVIAAALFFLFKRR